MRPQAALLAAAPLFYDFFDVYVAGTHAGAAALPLPAGLRDADVYVSMSYTIKDTRLPADTSVPLFVMQPLLNDSVFNSDRIGRQPGLADENILKGQQNCASFGILANQTTIGTCSSFVCEHLLEFLYGRDSW